MTNEPKRFVVLNPAAGQRSAVEVRAAVPDCFDMARVEIYETNGSENMVALLDEAVSQEAEQIVAAGGDGTVTEVINGLAGHDLPLGIIPIGTANNLARDLNLPLTIPEACALLAEETNLRYLDVLETGDQRLAIHVSIGVIAAVIETTSREAKNRYGIGAYLASLAKQLVNHEPHRFVLTVDGEVHEVSASEIMIANVAATGVPAVEWGTHIYPDDGQIDICVINVENWIEQADVLRSFAAGQAAASRYVRYLTATESIKVEARDGPQQIDGDGEIIGQTPFEAQVCPRAVKVLAPRQSEIRGAG